LRKASIVTIAFIIAITGYSQPATQVSKAVEDSAKARFQRNTHTVVLDGQSKIVSWMSPQSTAYDRFLHQRWNFIKTMVPNSPGPEPRSLYPQYYFYCAYRPKNGELEPDMWMNDVGEKIPNWFESARLYYAYTGDSSVMTIIRDFVDYEMEHGISPAHFSWPNFPYTTTNAGDTLFRGFTSANRFSLHEIQVDHAGEIGLTYYRMYQYTGNKKYLNAALNVANVLASKVRVGSATHSPWPYLVNMETGKVTCEYGANWSGCYTLLDQLARAGIGNVAAYRDACKKVKDFVLEFPMKTGYWTDGHSDVPVRSNTYKSNLSASNWKLFMLDYPEFNDNWKADIPKLIAWTEKYFVHRGDSSEPGTLWGANIVGEQDDFLFKMGYQTARYGAETARWYAISGDNAYKEKAYRSLNWVTYCSDSNGMAFESPLSNNISNWWSDCYGECPRMFYHALAAVPEWAPPGENHILYSKDVLTNVVYSGKSVEYTATGNNGIETFRLNFKPSTVTVDGKKLRQRSSADGSYYQTRKLPGGGYALEIFRKTDGKIVVSGS
jgi:hypothetical protein